MIETVIRTAHRACCHVAAGLYMTFCGEAHTGCNMDNFCLSRGCLEGLQGLCKSSALLLSQSCTSQVVAEHTWSLMYKIKFLFNG